jgi:precorrin-8X/cobalt-precorrin-8 methylmutase
VGFIGAAESKAKLWKNYQRLGIECMTLEGTQGGSAIAASAMNALLRIVQDLE